MFQNPNGKLAGQPQSSSHMTTQTNTQQVIVRLCTKIAALNNLNGKLKEDFVDSSYNFLTKTICSDAYSPTYEPFEISQKIKRQCTLNMFASYFLPSCFLFWNSCFVELKIVIRTNRERDAIHFAEIETKFGRLVYFFF